MTREGWLAEYTYRTGGEDQHIFRNTQGMKKVETEIEL